MDLLVGNLDGIIYMENNGTSTAPVFVRREGSANPFDGIDFFSWLEFYAQFKIPAPTLGDLDGDGTLRPCPSIDMLRPRVFVSPAGDLDLVVGDSYGSLTYIENTGTSTAPAFVPRTGSANPLNDIPWGGVGSYIYPTLGDLDGDGTLRRCPSIDKLRPHVFCRSQAIWTS